MPQEAASASSPQAPTQLLTINSQKLRRPEQVAFWRTAIASAQDGSEQLSAESGFRNTSLTVHSRECLKIDARGTYSPSEQLGLGQVFPEPGKLTVPPEPKQSAQRTFSDIKAEFKASGGNWYPRRGLSPSSRNVRLGLQAPSCCRFLQASNNVLVWLLVHVAETCCECSTRRLAKGSPVRALVFVLSLLGQALQQTAPSPFRIRPRGNPPCTIAASCEAVKVSL